MKGTWLGIMFIVLWFGLIAYVMQLYPEKPKPPDPLTVLDHRLSRLEERVRLLEHPVQDHKQIELDTARQLFHGKIRDPFERGSHVPDN